MIQSEIKKAKSRRLSAVFDRLSEKDQTYLETLTAQLAEIHQTSPETQFSTGKTSEDIVQQNKGQEP
jgi:hypothetical protein